MNGILLLDKPAGMTSHDVVRCVRRALKTRRIGHAGTLDPLATGVLPVAVGEATRILQFLTLADKSYRAGVLLGETTDTQDAEGTILERRSTAGVDCGAVAAGCREFTGTLQQIPPMYSAIKIDGTPLHRLARQGLEVERQARAIRVDRFQLLDCSLPNLVVEVDCSKGTYIRTLCHDLGQLLGCGAHVTSLRRTRVGPFAISDCLPLARLEAEGVPGKPYVLTADEALINLPAVEVSTAAASRLRHGRAPVLSECQFQEPLVEGVSVRLRQGDELLAVACYQPGGGLRGDFRLLRVLAVQDCD